MVEGESSYDPDHNSNDNPDNPSGADLNSSSEGGVDHGKPTSDSISEVTEHNKPSMGLLARVRQVIDRAFLWATLPNDVKQIFLNQDKIEDAIKGRLNEDSQREQLEKPEQEQSEEV